MSGPEQEPMEPLISTDPKQEMPPLRVWNVTRFNPLHQSDSPPHTPVVETISIMAHMIGQGPDGSLVFHMVRPHQGVLMSFVHRMFSYWLDVEEIVMPESNGRTH